MIVPFFFDLYEYTLQQPKLLAIYYRFVNFCTENKFPIIAQEKFVVNPEKYIEKNYWATSQEGEQTHKYKVPTPEELQDKLFLISKETEKLIEEEYKKYGDPAFENLNRRNKVLEKRLEEIIKEIEEKNKIEAFVTWIWHPSLEYVANKHNIKIICMELSTIRYPSYNDRLCYFSFKNKYDSSDINKLYEQFDKDNNLIFNREELLSIFLNKNDLYKIQNLYKNPKYEVGYALGLKDDYFEKKYSNINVEKLIKKVSTIYDKNQICVRPHPDNKKDLSKLDVIPDTSKSVLDFITNCKNMICNISNVAYEANLYGRNVINLSDCLPMSFGKKSSLENFEDSKMDLLHLNFLTFGIFVPYDLAFDIDYIKWRLKNPTINEIYNKNLEYILNQRNMNIKKLKKVELKERIDIILKNTHDLSQESIDEIKNYNYIDDEKIEMLEKENKNLKDDLNNILNSKGYKMLEKIRKIKSKLKK